MDSLLGSNTLLFAGQNGVPALLCRFDLSCHERRVDAREVFLGELPPVAACLKAAWKRNALWPEPSRARAVLALGSAMGSSVSLPLMKHRVRPFNGSKRESQSIMRLSCDPRQ